MNTIELLEKSYKTDGFGKPLPQGKYGSISFAGKNDAFFLDVAKETEKAVYFQFLGKYHWLPKSAFVIDKKYSDEKCVFFRIKPFFADKVWNNVIN